MFSAHASHVPEHALNSGARQTTRENYGKSPTTQRVTPSDSERLELDIFAYSREN